MENKIDIGCQLKKEKDKYWIIASSKDIDRDSEIILPSSFKNLDRYLNENPVILWAHDYKHPPVGKAVDYKVSDNDLKLQIEFAKTDFGKEIKYLYDNGFLNSFSVGFIPKEWEYDKDSNRVYTETEILETSAVPVPANAAANIIRACEEQGVELKYFKSDEVKSSKDAAEADLPEPDETRAENKKTSKGKYKWI